MVILSVLISLLVSAVSAQTFIYRGGMVYRYNKLKNQWSPLHEGDTLKATDYIKSKNIFTLEEIPEKWYERYNPFHINRCITYIAYPKGTYLNSKLVEFKRTFTGIQEGRINQSAQSAKKSAFLNHLSWIYQKRYNDSVPSVDIIVEINRSDQCIDRISISDSIKFTLINKNDINQYIYLLWKDKVWKLWNWNKEKRAGIRLSRYSCYSIRTGFSAKYNVPKDLLFICSSKELDDAELKSFETNSNIVPKYDDEYNQSKGYSFIVKPITSIH